MPTGPKGQKRPADVIGNAVRKKVLRFELMIERGLSKQPQTSGKEAHGATSA